MGCGKIIAGLVCLTLGGCAGMTPCASIAPAPAGDSLTIFARDAQSADGLLATARMATPTVACEKAEVAAVLTASVPITVERGPGLPDNTPVDVSYYLAAANAQGQEMARQAYTLQVDFPGSSGEAAATVTPSLHLPGADLNVTDLHLTVGFQLTPAQLAYNQARVAAPTP